jgi:hypothetical protein
MVPSYLLFTFLVVCLLLTNDNGVVAAFSSSKISSSTSSSVSLSMMTLETHEIVGCFGRLADKAFVPLPTEVQGTAASGYEFGVLQSGRPKWLCTYTERSGQTQGGGAELCHVPTWCSLLFPEEAAVAGTNGLTKSELISILQDETTKVRTLLLYCYIYIYIHIYYAHIFTESRLKIFHYSLSFSLSHTHTFTNKTRHNTIRSLL